MVRKSSLVALVGLSVFAASASAQSISLSKVSDPFAGYDGFIASVTAPFPITVLDFSTGARGITVPATQKMSQRWAFNADTEAFDPSPAGSLLTSGTGPQDSRFLFSTTYAGPASQGFRSFATTVAPFENNDSINLPGQGTDSASFDFGGGTFLETVVGIDNGVLSGGTNYQQNTVAFAYLVLPENYSVTFNGTANGAQGQNLDFNITVVPEPASLAVLGLAGLMGLRRRRA
jgi:hypothetical protein